MARDKPDRRRDLRVTSLNLVQVDQSENELQTNLTVGRTLNISRGGLRLELQETLPLRSLVGLTLALGEHIIEVTGRVRYLNKLDDGTCAMGIQFVDLTAEQQALIDKIVRERG